MKKIYSKPKTQCIEVKMQKMVCTSGINNTSGAEGLGTGGNTGDAGILEAGARTGSLWDED